MVGARARTAAILQHPSAWKSGAPTSQWSLTSRGALGTEIALPGLVRNKVALSQHVYMILDYRLASRLVLPCRQPYEEQSFAAIQKRIQETCISLGVQADLSTPMADQ